MQILSLTTFFFVSQFKQLWWKGSVSDRQADSSNHETIHAPLHDALYVLACEARLTAEHEGPTCVYTTLCKTTEFIILFS